jgi:hypothetical protein
MWRKLKNLFLSFKTYDVLSPELQVRQQVNHRLSHRPALSLEEWFEAYWQPHGISLAIAQFVYLHLEQYSGLVCAKVLPIDRLEKDLHWTEVCWYDWELSLCDDFWQCFGVDLSDRLEEFHPTTIADLIWFLHLQLPTVDDPGKNKAKGVNL